MRNVSLKYQRKIYFPFGKEAFENNINLTNWRQFFMRLSCYWSWISPSHCQSSCGLLWQCYDEIMINNRRDALKTDVNLFFTITNSRIAGSRSLTRRMNFKFMSVRILTIKISQWARVDFCSYRKNRNDFAQTLEDVSVVSRHWLPMLIYRNVSI